MAKFAEFAGGYINLNQVIYVGKEKDIFFENGKTFGFIVIRGANGENFHEKVPTEDISHRISEIIMESL